MNYYGAIIPRCVGVKRESAGTVRSPAGNVEWVVDAGRTIGFERNTGPATSICTVITNTAGSLITAFPGRP